ncbi:MAG: hypothetical protein V4673_06720 [Pseudomonadota bacterium]
MSGSGRDTKLTTFLTTEHGRAPSAYHVDLQSVSQRARQEHRSGPTLTSEKLRIQAFTQTKQMAKAVSKLVKHDSRRLGVDPEFALRLQIMDGLASPTIQAGKAHLEVSHSEFGKGNPHVSGGAVMFPARDSPLSNFDQVAATTSMRRGQIRARSAVTPPITQTMSPQITPQAEAFNDEALRAQHGFARSLLKGK